MEALHLTSSTSSPLILFEHIHSVTILHKQAIKLTSDAMINTLQDDTVKTTDSRHLSFTLQRHHPGIHIVLHGKL